MDDHWRWDKVFERYFKDRAPRDWDLPALVKDIAMKERERCAKIAEERTRYSAPGDEMFDCGWKRCAEEITKKIRGS